MANELDAYGHLTWTVGNEDYTACFDAIRKGEHIAFHVVANCESAGFVDTVQAGAVPLAEVGRLYDLPDAWADKIREQYAGSRKREHHVGVRELMRTRRAWRQHLDEIAGLPPATSGGTVRARRMTAAQRSKAAGLAGQHAPGWPKGKPRGTSPLKGRKRVQA